MRSVVLAPFVLVLFVCLAASQTTSSNPPQSKLSEVSSELDEASRLSQSVIELYKAKKYDEAFPIAKRVLEIRKRVLGHDDDQVVQAVLNLAEIQLLRENYLEAKSLLEGAVHSYEATSGFESLKVASVLDRLAIVNYRLGNDDATERDFKRALAIREKALGKEHSDVGKSLDNLATLYQSQGAYDKANPLYERLIEIRKKGRSIESTVDVLDRYACVVRKAGRASEADRLEAESFALGHPAGDAGALYPVGVVNGRALHLYQPAYPAKAKAARVSGTVTVRVVINESGEVIRACAIDGPRLLVSASEAAAYQSTFTPTSIDDKPVKVTGTIVYRFIAQ